MTACTATGVVMSTGATVGVAASEERGVKGTIKDAGIRIQINDLWLKAGLELYNFCLLYTSDAADE